MRLARPEHLMAAGVTLVCLAVMERLPILRVRTPTRAELESGFANPYPAARSDYLTFTLPRGETITGPGFGTITTNALGYRGPYPRSVEKPAGTRRLLFLGDSFTLGWGLTQEATIPAQFQQWLTERGENWEVVNAAYHAGCSPDAYYAYLVREGLALRPDAVIVVLYTNNDITDLQDNVWAQLDASGAPTALSTIRAYPDYRGRMMDLSLLPWYYDIPVLSRLHVFLNAAALVSRPFNGVGVVGSGRLGRPVSEDEARRRFAVVTRATAALAARSGVPLSYAALALPGTAAADDRFYPQVHRVVAEELGLPLLGLHAEIRPQDAIGGDAHLNEEGARRAASVLWSWWSRHPRSPLVPRPAP